MQGPVDISELEFQRMRLAMEQMTMTWITTSTSLITFGFTVYKFFQIESARGEGPRRLVGPREFAIAMISVGLIGLVLATAQQLRNMKELRVRYKTAKIPRSLASFISVLMSALGVFALLVTIFRE